MGIEKIIEANMKKIEISDSNLAQKIGVSETSVKNWKDGNAVPSGIYLLKLIKILDLDIDQLLNIVNIDIS